MSDQITNSDAAHRNTPAFLRDARFIELDGKVPLRSSWSHDPRVWLDADQAEQRLDARKNVGVVLGQDDFVLDVDPKNGGKASFEQLQADLGTDFSGYPAVRTGSGGLHIYMRLPKDADRLKGNLERDGYPGIDVKHVGGQVVAPGSIHPDTGRRYKVIQDLDALDELDGVPEAPEALMRLVSRPQQALDQAPPGSMSPERLAAILDDLDVGIYRGDHAKWLELMMACHDATGGAGCTEFADWSISDPEYSGHAEIIGRRWDSLGGSNGPRITVATLWKHLADAGVAHLVEPDEAEARADFEGFDAESVQELPASVTPHEAQRQRRLHRQTKLPETVAEINKQGYIATKDEGCFRVYRQVWDYELDRTFWEVQKKQDFLDNLAGFSVLGETPQGRETRVPVAAAWLKWPGRNRATSVKFDPANRIPASAHVLNLWTGWTVDPQPGDWSLMKQLLLEGLCDGNQELYEYVLDWSAFMVQHPDKPAEVAIFFVGDKGTGKGTYCRTLCELAGRHGMHVASPSHFGGHFNAHMRDCIVLFADEAFWAGDKKAEGQLKAFITEPTIVIEGKGKDAVVCRNYLHVMGASNNPWVWQASDDERRLVTNRVSNRFKDDHAFFTALRAQMDAGGRAAMLHELLARDIADFHPRKNRPKTDELRRQVELSRPRVIQLLEDMRSDGFGPFDEGHELIGIHEDILSLKPIQQSVDRLGHVQVRRQIEDWLAGMGAVVHERCKKRGTGLHARPTERLWSLGDHERYAGMSAIERADEYLRQRHEAS